MIDESLNRELTQGGPEEVMLGPCVASPALHAAGLPPSGGASPDIAHRTYTPGDEAPRNELVLIERILAGERELFMQLVRPYQKLVYSMAVSIVKSEHEAEDVSQEAFFKAFKNLSQFRGECKFS